LLLLKGLEGSH